MCHIITFKKRLQSLNNVTANCLRDTIFDDCCQPIFVALRTSGIYPIKHGRKGYAYCDMETDGGGWVVVARRAGGKRDFNRTWRRYKKGFGPLDKDFWIGLDAMYLLTPPFVSAELRFDMRHENGSWYHAYYNQIIVGPESDNYRLTARGYDPERSTIYDAFSAHDGHPFSTKDNLNVDFQKVRPKQWLCGNRPRITWETTQYRFLYREEEEDEGGEDKTEMPTSNATIATPVPTVSEPVPDTENKHVAPTDSAEERGSGNKEQLDMVSPVTELVDKDKATTAPTTFTPGAEEGNTPDPAASTMTPPTPSP